MASLDLHLHTEKSDGENTVRSIIDLAIQSGVKIFSITDHNTISGYLEAKLNKNNLLLIPGVEISTYDKEKSLDVDILGYFYNPENKQLLDLLEFSKKESAINNANKIEALRSKGVEITMDDVLEVAGGKMISKHHFVEVLKESNYLHLITYSDEKNPYAFLKKYTKSPKTQVQPKDAIEAIVSAGGIAVIAHVYHTMKNFSDQEVVSVIEKYFSYGLGGLEVYYPSHNKEQIEFLESLCNDKGLLATGGSDFHGSSSKCSIGEFEIPKEKVKSLSMKLLELAKSRQ